MYPGWRCALPWAISLCPVGANDPGEKTRGLSPGFFHCMYRQIGPVEFKPQGNYSSDLQGLFGISGCRTGPGKFLFMPILVGFAGPVYSPRSYTTHFGSPMKSSESRSLSVLGKTPGKSPGKFAV